MRIVVIGGGPGAGKTAVIEELARRGYGIVPEIARQIIQEQVQSGGAAVPWGDTRLYTQLMLSRSVESFHQQNGVSEMTFLDRGIPDVLCYARIIGLPDVREIESACRAYRYNRRVFLLPPWKEIYRTDLERKQTFAEAVQVYETMICV